MLGLENFDFVTIWSPLFFLLILGITVLYFMLIGPWSHHFSEREPVSPRKKLSFVSAMLLFYLAQGGPINLLGHLTFSGHMVAMSISYLVVPPLLLYGLPAWLLRPFLQDKWFQVFRRRFLHPVFTVLFFNSLFSAYHFPAIHDFVMTNYAVHILVYFILFTAALMMWWPIVCPIPEMNTLSDLRKMGYIFINGMLLTPACALIIFAPSAVYATYTDPIHWAKAVAFCIPAGASLDVLSQLSGPEQFSIMNPRHDQQLGGVIMKLMQETMYGSILYYIFHHWYRKESDEGDSAEQSSDTSFEGQLKQA